MKKLLILIISFMLLSITYVFADSNVEYDISGVGISFNDNVLTLDNYSHNDGDYTTSNDYAIECDGDLTINLIGDNYINTDGIYVDGDLTFTGDGTLLVETIEVYGDNLTVSSTITVDATNGYYTLPYLSRPGSVRDIDGNELRYDKFNGTYNSFMDDTPIDEILLLNSHFSANLDNIDDTSTIYDNWSYQEYTNIKGLAYIDGDNTDSINYDSSTSTYTIKYKDNEDKYIRMVFNTNELGKDIYFKVLKANNIQGINEGDELYPTDYIGQEVCLTSSVPGSVIGGMSKLLFKNTTNDYYLKLEVIGGSGNHRYININYVDDEIKQNNNVNDIKYEFIVPNTGVKE